jgi:glycerol-3-phosphate O-acyltransferase/dihydroxyacetone phosphate acyltransferase
LLSGTIVWFLVTLATFPLSGLTFFVFPFFMWFSLRWLEDCLSSLRAAIALLSMLAIGKSRLKEIRKLRQDLYERVKRVAVERAELPEDIDVFVKEAKERRLKERGGKVGRLGYFSLRRRRKKDYNEVRACRQVAVFLAELTLRFVYFQLMYLWDQSEYAM